MDGHLSRICQWCEQPFTGNRKFCSSECRHEAQESWNPDPTPDEIRELCSRIREEGGPAWERSRSCYPAQPVHMRLVHSRRFCLAVGDE